MLPFAQLSCDKNSVLQALEEERRKGSKALREAKATAEANLTKAEQAVATAEQQRQEAVKQAEADARRASVKLTQASKSCRTARQEASDAQKHVEVCKWIHKRNLC